VFSRRQARQVTSPKAYCGKLPSASVIFLVLFRMSERGQVPGAVWGAFRELHQHPGSASIPSTAGVSKARYLCETSQALAPRTPVESCSCKFALCSAASGTRILFADADRRPPSGGTAQVVYRRSRPFVSVTGSNDWVFCGFGFWYSVPPALSLLLLAGRRVCSGWTGLTGGLEDWVGDHEQDLRNPLRPKRATLYQFFSLPLRSLGRYYACDGAANPDLSDGLHSRAVLHSERGAK
jgi:hypothetical protein